MAITVTLSSPEVKWGMLSQLEPGAWTVQYWLKFSIGNSGEAQSPATLAILAAETTEEAVARANHYQEGIQSYIKDLDLPEAITAFKGLIGDITIEEAGKLEGPPSVDNN